MEIPRRITFQWLVRTVPGLSADDYEQVVFALAERGWITQEIALYGAPWNNFVQLLDYLLPRAERLDVEMRRGGRSATRMAA